jgi:hypothetical protein
MRAECRVFSRKQGSSASEEDPPYHGGLKPKPITSSLPATSARPPTAPESAFARRSHPW